MALDILIVDDEADIRELVAGVLEDEGFATRTAANSDDALEALDARRPSLVLLDIWLQGSRMDGLELLDEIKQRDATIPVLIISGHGNIDTAVAAIRKRGNVPLLVGGTMLYFRALFDGLDVQQVFAAVSAHRLVPMHDAGKDRECDHHQGPLVHGAAPTLVDGGGMTRKSSSWTWLTW